VRWVTAALAALVMLGLQTKAQSPALWRLTPRPPAQEAGLRSERSDMPSAIHFINRTPADLQLIWLDFDGRRQLYGTIPASQTLHRTTYATHVWLLADGAGTALALFVAEDKEGIAEIGAGTNQPAAVVAPGHPQPPTPKARDVTFLVTSDVLCFFGHTGTGLRKWAPEPASSPLDCVNTGPAEKGFFVVQFQGARLRLAYRLKRVQEEVLPDRRRRWNWDGTWEWRRLFEKKLRTDGRPEPSAPSQP
jgi:hypothetical protein